jgi:hypothetical protein
VPVPWPANAEFGIAYASTFLSLQILSSERSGSRERQAGGPVYRRGTHCSAYSEYSESLTESRQLKPVIQCCSGGEKCKKRGTRSVNLLGKRSSNLFEPTGFLSVSFASYSANVVLNFFFISSLTGQPRNSLFDASFFQSRSPRS